MTSTPSASPSASSPATVLVIGSTGKTGRRVARVLREQGLGVRAASRGSAVAAERFDWTAPGTWDAALDGVDAVYVSYQPDLSVPGALEQTRALAARIAAAGITRVAFLSARGQTSAVACEEAFRDAVPTATVLRCSWFAQNFSEGALREPALGGMVSLPAPAERTEPFLDMDDLAACVAVVLADPNHEGRTYTLTGPEAPALSEVAAVLSKTLERTVSYVGADPEHFAQHLQSIGMPADAAGLVTATFAELLDGRNSKITEDVAELLHRPAGSFTAFADRAEKAGAWA